MPNSIVNMDFIILIIVMNYRNAVIDDLVSFFLHGQHM